MDQVMTGLPLFDWQPPTDRVVLFPLARQTSRVQSIAAGLRCRSGEEASDFWRTTMEQLDFEMVSLGIDEGTKNRAKWAFFNAVQAELDRQGQPAGQDGAPLSGAN